MCSHRGTCVTHDKSQFLCCCCNVSLILQEEVLWSCLAAMAAYAKELNTAEVAYAAIKEACTMYMASEGFIFSSAEHRHMWAFVLSCTVCGVQSLV